MKATKIFLSLALVALTATSFGQHSFKGRFSARNHNQVAYYTADYKTENRRLESWMHDLRCWATEKISRDVYEAPVVDQAFVVGNAEVVYEEKLGLESWMSTPFEPGFNEETVILESWMSQPFETSLGEEELSVEEWMTTPFEADNAIELEDWMTTAWI